MKWIKRWRKIGYRNLWHLHFGGLDEGDKGCQREYIFLAEVTSGWHHAYQTERELRVEAEKILADNGIETPTEKRRKLLKERYPNAV